MKFTRIYHQSTAWNCSVQAKKLDKNKLSQFVSVSSWGWRPFKTSLCISRHCTWDREAGEVSPTITGLCLTGNIISSTLACDSPRSYRDVPYRSGYGFTRCTCNNDRALVSSTITTLSTKDLALVRIRTHTEPTSYSPTYPIPWTEFP